MLLRPAVLDESIIGKPLPWDVYTAAGVLLSPAGMMVDDEAHFQRLKSRPLFRPAGPEGDQTRPADTLLDLVATLDALYEDPQDPDLMAGIQVATQTILALMEADADAALGLTRCLPLASPATRHCLLCALICASMAEHQGLEKPVIASLVSAALTMNISAMKLHASLIGQRDLDPETRATIQEHPGAAVDVLYKAGVRDRIWLDTVMQHHENMDGSGYPTGLSLGDICQTARMLRVVDLYCAKVSGRHYRPPRSSMFAMQYMFGQERRKVDTQMAHLLLRRYGFFPPGTLLQLANQETAVVTRVHGQRHPLKHVVSFLDARGRVLERPAERDTQKPGFAVSRLAEPAPDWPEVDWQAIWGYP